MNCLKKRITSCARLLLVVAVVNGIAVADDIWDRRIDDRVHLFRDTAAREIGDLVTILVRETTDVANNDQRALGKSTDANFNFNVASSGNGGSSSGTFDINGNSDRTFAGSSQFSVAQALDDRITVEIVGKQPNGNLILQGKRQRQVAGEIRTLIISGVIRTADIGPSNIIRSQYVSNFSVCYEGNGPETSFTRQGWAGRIMNKIWPF